MIGKKLSVHLKHPNPINALAMGQTIAEYENQALCGYVRKLVTRDIKQVTCKQCLYAAGKKFVEGGL